jgi:penicillin-binding protein 2
MKNKKAPNTNIRYAAIAVSFGVICLAFIIALAVVQIKGPQTEYVGDDGTITKTVTVSGLRGEIYDRNGKLLVGNATTYDLIYEYGAMPETYNEINRELLDTLVAIRQTNNSDKLCGDFFPLTGVYPDLVYVGEIADASSDHSHYLSRFLERSNMSADTTPKELADYLSSKYKISEEKYNTSEMLSLMRLWYEMERVGFGAFQFYTIAENVSVELLTYVEEKGITGTNFKTVATRVYNYPGVASHILGRVGKINAENAEHYSELGYPMDAYVGIDGCELAFENILHGQDGVMVIKYDANGTIIEKYYEKQPISGNDVWLTIDVDLQIAAENGLKEAAETSGTGESGAITVTDPDSGAVLAMASYPTYDLTQFSSVAYVNSLLENKSKPFLNRAISGAYAPGSTYKIGVALAALENGTITDSYEYACGGTYPHLDHPTCLGVHAQGNNVYNAIQESCNLFFYNLGHKMGISSVTGYTQSLGLGVTTGIELPERVGTVAGPAYTAEWNAGNDVQAAIGQSDHTYTPLQLGIYMSSIVNGGDRYCAHLLDSVRSFYTKEIISQYTPTIADTVAFSESTYNTLMTSMGMVISNNSEVSRYFRNVPVKVGGKTGTAEVTGKLDNALFTGFAPLEDPEIVVSCIIEEGQHGYFASIAAARVMEEYFKDKQ